MRRLVALTVLAVLSAAAPAAADHAWDGYHWGTTDGVVDLFADVHVSGGWTEAVASALTDWDADPHVVIDTDPAGKQGSVRIESKKYGNTGWLGIAEIWVEPDGHITQGRVRLNEWYWTRWWYGLDQRDRIHVACQEVGHILGLDHQQATSCMDDTAIDRNDTEDGYLHPNSHDHEQLAAIYGHTDGVDSGTPPSGGDGGGGCKGRGNKRCQGRWVVVHITPAPAWR